VSLKTALIIAGAAHFRAGTGKTLQQSDSDLAQTGPPEGAAEFCVVNVQG